MDDSLLLNPGGQLLPELAGRMFQARKAKAVWAKKVAANQPMQTLEGRLVVGPDDYLCRGVAGEHWPQKFHNLLDKYLPSGEFDADGWQRFDPKPQSAPVLAAQMDIPFRVIAPRGILSGKAQDYVVCSTTDSMDVWIVDQGVFEATYELVKNQQT